MQKIVAIIYIPTMLLKNLVTISFNKNLQLWLLILCPADIKQVGILGQILNWWIPI